MNMKNSKETTPENAPAASEGRLSNPVLVVRAFTKAWTDRDIDAICGMLTEDCVWQNPQSPPFIGWEAVRAAITPPVSRADSIEMDLLNIALCPDGKTVLCERRDAMIYGPNRIPISVMGAFEIRKGRIAAWRDYFDQGVYLRSVAAIGQKSGIA